MQTKPDGWNHCFGFFVIEDCHRKTQLSDYPYLAEVYKNNPEEFEASDNLIKVLAIMTEHYPRKT